MSTGRGRLSTALAATGAVLVAVGVVAWLPGSPAAEAPDPRLDPSPVRAAEVASPPQPTPAARRPGDPRRLTIPSLGVAARVMPVRAPRNTLVPPADADRLGWWADGARPGAARGAALLAGHTVHTGGGALDDLERVERGAEVVVRTDRERLVYEVTQVRVYSKGRLSRVAERVFDQESPGRLVLVTCEDWDGSQYLSNVVVVARPVEG